MLVTLLVVSLPAPAYAGWFDKAKDWVDGAADDTKDWVDGATDDAKDWTKGAVKDASEVIDKAFMDNSEQSELDVLPILNVNLNTMTNVQTDASGTFVYGNNVKQKKLPAATAKT